MTTKIIHVQSVLPFEDTMALKKKTGEASNKEAFFVGLEWIRNFQVFNYIYLLLVTILTFLLLKK